MPDMWVDVDAAVTVPVNILPLIDDTDFKTREESVTFDRAGLDLLWNFQTTAGVQTQVAVTPTDTAGVYDWTNVGNGLYKIEIPASAGGTINNDSEGFGWFSGFATGILPWRGPIIGFRVAGINNVLIDSAYSATRGLAGTALPDAVADAIGGLPISDAGGLDLDAMDTNVSAIPTTAMRGTDSAATAVNLATLQTTADGIPTTAEFDARTLVAASYFDPAADTVTTVTTVTNQLTAAEINAEVDTALNTAIPGTPTANSINQRMVAIDALTEANGAGDLASVKTTVEAIPTTAMRGTDSAALATALVTAQTAIDAIPTTAMRGTDSAALATALVTAQTAIDAIPTTAMRGTDSAATAAALTTAQASIDALFTTALTESYSADGSAPTVAQALMLIMQALTEFSISGTVITAKKLDGSTTAATFTLDDSTNPTSRTRAS